MRLFFWSIIKRVLFLLDAERAHRLTVRLIHLGSRMGSAPLRIVSGAKRDYYPPTALPKVLGMEFRSRVGLAAGFDKDAEILDALPALGFGFAEIGTVTPRPQPGNDRPRLFRDPARESLFNRMGFNGLGAKIVSDRLARLKPRLPAGFRVGVNLGKNKDTPLENAASDYVKAAENFQGLADYVVINVSSPNTPGLRSLQTIEALKPIVEGVNGVISRWGRRPPLLLKLAPEVTGDELAGVMREAERFGIDGWILTNTLGGPFSRGGDASPLTGGWSGGALTEKARRSLIEARRVSKLPIISVGGILTEDEAEIRRSEGADLIQIYTGWIYRGPGFPARVGARLARADLQK